MQFIRQPAKNAFTSISLPDLELNGGRYYSPSFWPKRYWGFEVLFAFDGLESKLKYRAHPVHVSTR